MQLIFIESTNKLLQEKVRYFANYFSYTNEYLGLLPEIPFDNQLSLIDKSIFQIENNLTYCELYVNNYLTELFTFYKDYSGTSSLKFEEIKVAFALFKSVGNKQNWLNNNSNFLNSLKELRDDYENNLFDLAHAQLYKIIACNCNLKKHKIEINRLTQIIVSLFRFKNYSKKFVANFMQRIFGVDPFDFPYPAEFLEIKDQSLLESTVKKHFAKIKFDDRFQGIKNLYVRANNQKGLFFYVIKNVSLDEGLKLFFKVKFDKVTFISPQHADLKRMRRNLRKWDKEKNDNVYLTFFRKDSLLAFITFNYETQASKREEGLEIVNAELLYLIKYLGKRLSIYNDSYLVIDSLESDSWSSMINRIRTPKVRISEFRFDWMKKNSFERLRKNTSTAKGQILNAENFLLRAKVDRRIEYYWIFLESIFYSWVSNSDKMRKKMIQLLLKTASELKIDFLLFIVNLLDSKIFRLEQDGLTKENIFFLRNEVIENRNYNFEFSKFTPKVKNEFIRDLFKAHLDFDSAKSIDKWRKHFTSILLDLYAYRNSLVHSGLENKYARIKLEDSLSIMFEHLRLLILKKCEEDENVAYEKLIQNILK